MIADVVAALLARRCCRGMEVRRDMRGVASRNWVLIRGSVSDQETQCNCAVLNLASSSSSSISYGKHFFHSEVALDCVSSRLLGDIHALEGRIVRI